MKTVCSFVLGKFFSLIFFRDHLSQKLQQSSKYTEEKLLLSSVTSEWLYPSSISKATSALRFS